jgi:nucleoside-diphosphate-sugar epimerase
MRYFVTGGTGFIGGRLIRALRRSGHEVVALARDPGRAGDLAALGVTLARGDVTERTSLTDPMRGADGVFHVAAWYKLGERDRGAAWRINVDGTRHVLETMAELGVARGVYTSTLAVFSDTHGRIVDESYRYRGPHLSEYDRTKAAAHWDVALPMMARGLPLIVVQPGLNYGPGDTSSVRNTFIQYLKGALPLLPLETAFCWAHVEDTVAGHLAAMERGRPGESYILGGPVHTMVDAFETAERITGVRAPRLRVPPAVMRAAAALMGAIAPLAPVPPSYAREALRVIAGVTYTGSNAKARRELGFSPRPLEEGLRETLRHEMALLGMPIPGETGAARAGRGGT